MIRLTSIRLDPTLPEGDWPAHIAALLRLPPEDIRSIRPVRRSVDARRKEEIRLVLTLDVEVAGDEQAILARSRCAQATIAPRPLASGPWAQSLAAAPPLRPVVVGSGPAGLFAALTLAQTGARPLLLERGRDVDRRRQDVRALWESGVLDPVSNVQFGEGGAGTFSDGKLNTGIKNPRCRHVLNAFVEHGAPEDILWQAKPHMGTDRLIEVVRRMRGTIQALGGQVRFEAQLTGLHVDKGILRGVQIGPESLEADSLLLCIGHSARDTFSMLHDAGVAMEQKPFSIGVRVEHPQALIDRAQYGALAGQPSLGAADYKLSLRLPDGRGVYTFCMCPGGMVVAAASEPGGVVTNGMSLYARDGVNANSAILVDVRPEDFGDVHPLAGLRFQRKWEALAFSVGGGDYRAPAQRASDFIARQASRSLDGLAPTYRPGVTPSDLRACLPDFVAEAIAQALPRFDRQLRGFAGPGALLTGVETRSSCPLRVLRDDRGQASIQGIFPAGEGAGYAGGIMSAAVDGIRAAELLLDRYTNASNGGTL